MNNTEQIKNKLQNLFLLLRPDNMKVSLSKKNSIIDMIDCITELTELKIHNEKLYPKYAGSTISWDDN